MRRCVAGIDVGGTFTDLVLHESDGAQSRVVFAKVPTTTANQADGVLAAIAQAGVPAADIDLLIHGTTATTNALLERKLARVGLITTDGFRDTLELGRRTRPHAYGLFGVFEPLIPRELRIEVPERLDATGAVVTALDGAAVTAAATALLAAGCEAIVVHFLHSYANPMHELRAGELIRAIWPNDYITLGHALLSEYREYERGTTASVNAAVQPILDRYLARLSARLREAGFARELLVMNGNGGTVAAGLAAREAARTVMSGPASGVIAAAATLGQAGLGDAVTYDMGGTSSDVALIAGGLPAVSSELTLEYGIPIHVPMVDVHTIGAGGGSVAWLDAAGMLRVGPESAGALPGPICYGRGGTRPTITDANLLLGRLDPRAVGDVPPEVVREAFQVQLAQPLGISVEAAAAAVVRLGNLHMAGAIRLVTLARGRDPRELILFAFGGAGPLHAVALARDLGIPEVLVPARPGLTNALGCLLADLRQDFVRTVNVPLAGADMAALHGVLAAHEARGRDIIAGQSGEIEEIQVVHVADMQFQGQTHLLRVTLDDAHPTQDWLQQKFEAVYFARFQVRLPEIRAVVVNLHSSVIGRRARFDVAALLDPASRAASVVEARKGMRRIYADGNWIDVPVYAREALPLGGLVAGPAMIEQPDTTIVLEPDSAARVDPIGNLRISVGAAR